MLMGGVVSNASPLIALNQIGRIDLLEKLLGTVAIPEAVAREVAPSVILPNWIERAQVGSSTVATLLSATLGVGESETICLALERRAEIVLLDDRPARRAAQSLHLPVFGTLRVLLIAKNRGLLLAVKPEFD